MKYEISEEVAHINGHPEKLVIFLHGYIDSDTSVDKRLSYLIDNLDNTAIHIPQAPLQCEIHERKRQWYSMHRFDPDDARKTVATMEECAGFYNRMGDGFNEAFMYLNPYIDQCLNEYQLEDKDLYICGFSQGAMLAIYTSLMREETIGGCISFSGILAPHGYLMKNHNATPDMLLIHGDADTLVRYEALEFSRSRLEQIGCRTTTFTVSGGQHTISEDGLKQAVDYIKQHSIRKIAV